MRALFVNSGILGHRTVLRLLREAVARDSGIDATFIDLAEGLTTRERIVRRVVCAGPRGAASFPGAALLLPRFRHEWHAGLQAARRIAAAERAGGPFGVLHFHTQATAYASLPRMRHTPSVVSLDITQRLASAEALSPLQRLDYAPNMARDRAVFRAARAIVATSRWAADDLVDAQPECADRVHVMPYPVPLDAFDAAWIEERFARSVREPEASVRFLFIGGDFPRTGGFELLDAWRRGGFAGRAVLTLVTDWSLPDDDLPPGVAVRRGVRSYTPEWLDAWREADAFVMPTRGEAFGMVFQEAGAAGLPSIGTRINAVPEIVEDGAGGVLVPPGDVDALIDAMRGMMGSAARRRAMGEAARRRIASVSAPDAYADRLTSLLRRVAAEGARG